MRDLGWRDCSQRRTRAFSERIFASLGKPAAVTRELDVAEAVWLAANDSTGTLRFPAGPDAVALARSGMTVVVSRSRQ
jgi:hypothetical protein